MREDGGPQGRPLGAVHAGAGGSVVIGYGTARETVVCA